MSEHLSSTELALYVSGHGSGAIDAEGARVLAHASECDDCRDRLRAEAAFEVRLARVADELSGCATCGAITASPRDGTCMRCAGAVRAVAGAEPIARKTMATTSHWRRARVPTLAFVGLAAAGLLAFAMIKRSGDSSDVTAPGAGRGHTADAARAPTCPANPDRVSADGRASFYFPYGKSPGCASHGTGSRFRSISAVRTRRRERSSSPRFTCSEPRRVTESCWSRQAKPSTRSVCGHFGRTLGLRVAMRSRRAFSTRPCADHKLASRRAPRICRRKICLRASTLSSMSTMPKRRPIASSRGGTLRIGVRPLGHATPTEVVLQWPGTETMLGTQAVVSGSVEKFRAASKALQPSQ